MCLLLSPGLTYFTEGPIGQLQLHRLNKLFKVIYI